MDLLSLGSLGAKVFGMFSSNKNAKRNRALQRETNKIAVDQFNQQMDHSISRRVKDAVRAGIHPLFAMGASVGSSPTAHVDSSPTGSGVGDALNSIGDQLGMMRVNNARAKRDEAEAALLDSERKRMEGNLVSRGHDGVPSVKTFPLGTETPDIAFGPGEFYNPQIPVSKSRGVRAGTQPGLIDMQMPDGRKVQLYDPDLGLDEIGQVKYVLQRAQHYAADAMMWASKNLSDQAIIAAAKKAGRSAGLSDKQLIDKFVRSLSRKDVLKRRRYRP